MVKLYLFGPPRIEVDQQPIEFNLKKALAMLAYVAIEGSTHSRDALATMFWADSDQSTARANLRRTLYRLNQAVGTDVLLATADTITLNPEVQVWVDVLAFSEYYQNQQWQAGADLFQDEFLSGFSLPDCLEFDEWQFFTGENLRQNLTHCLRNLTEQVSGEDAIHYLRQLVWLDPLDEGVHRRLMQAYASSGHRAAALRQYEECKRILDEELGAAPQPETNELYHTIRSGKSPSTPRPQTQFVKSGDVHVAYQVLGDGPVDLVFVNGFISHLDVVWEDAPLVQFLTSLTANCRLILFDKRGVGLSDRVGQAPTLDETMDDICAVMNAVGSEQAVLFGVSEGGPASIMMSVTHPDRVQGLILYGTGARFSRDSEYPWAPPERLYRRWHELMLENWGTPVGIEIFTTTRANEPQMRDWWARLLRLGSSAGAIKALLDAMQQIDVRHLLPSIRVPTLIIHRSDDKVKWVGNGRYLASHIPGAQYLELAGEDHLWWVGDTAPILDAVHDFVDRVARTEPTRFVLLTLLATNSPVPETLIQRYRGQPIERSEEVSVIAFDGPTRALHCARLHQSQFPEVKTGLHAGECMVQNGYISGAVVRIALQLMAKASPDTILVSNTVKDLVSSPIFDFREGDMLQSWQTFTMV